MKNLIHEDLLEAIELTIKARNKLNVLQGISELKAYSTEHDECCESMNTILFELSKELGYVICDTVENWIEEEEKKEVKAKS